MLFCNLAGYQNKKKTPPLVPLNYTNTANTSVLLTKLLTKTFECSLFSPN